MSGGTDDAGVLHVAREVTWFERTDNPPDVAPLAGQNERVILRVPIGQRSEGQRVTIPRLDPPAESGRKNEHQAEADGSAGEAAAKTWPAPKEELEQLVQQGLSNREIGERYGVSAVTVQARLQQLGIRRDPETRAKLLSRGGRKGRQAGWKRNDLFMPKPAELSNAREELPEAVVAQQDETPAPAGSSKSAGDSDPLEEFAKGIAQAVRHALQMGRDVEISLRVGGAA